MINVARQNYRLWHVKVHATALKGPPYPKDMPITSESVYSDNVWYEHSDNLPAGGKNRRTYDFFAPSQTHRSGLLSLPEHEDLLLTQFKEAMVGVRHHRDTLGPKTKLLKMPKPRTWYGNHRQFRRIFASASQLKVCDIREFDQDNLRDLLEIFRLARTEKFNLGVHLDYIWRLAENKLLSGEREMSRLELVHDVEPTDANRAIGVQALTDDQTQMVISLSLVYIEKSTQIANMIESVRKGICSQENARNWMARNFPCTADLSHSPMPETAILLVQVAAGNLIGFHLGLRPSETLSMLSGCVHSGETPLIDLQRMSIVFQTYKAIRKAGGDTRYLAVSSFVKTVVNAIELVMTAAGAVSDHLFSDPKQSDEFNDNAWNYRSQRFCELHKLDFHYTSSTWRKSLLSITMSAFDNPMSELSELANHLSKNTTAGYAQSSPFIIDEYQQGYTEVLRRRFKTLFESSAALGGPGLGGPQGLTIERRLPELISTDVTELDLGVTMDEYIDDLLEQGVTPMLVRPGILCVKGHNSPGYCSRATGDPLPDTSKCSAFCEFQAQLPEVRRTLEWELGQLASIAEKKAFSNLQRDYWVNSILTRLNAWPTLMPRLREIVSQSRKLSEWFAEKI